MANWVKRSVPSRLLSAKKDTRIVTRRDGDGLMPGDTVQSVGETWRVQGRIARTGDLVLERTTGAT